MPEDDPRQIEMMCFLYRAHDRDQRAVCAAYAQYEIGMRANRPIKKFGLSPEAYAKALWRDGKARGWLK